MAVIVLGAAKGSPGASTTALALAAAWPGGARPLVVEADEAGGDALLRFGMRESPGLVSLAAASRRASVNGAMTLAHAQQLPGGVDVVVAPAERTQCVAALEALGPAWAEAELDDVLLIADCGRLAQVGSATAALLRRSDALVLVTAGSLEALAHTAETADRLRPQVRSLLIAVIGSCAWPAAEVEAALGADGCFVLPHDPASAAMLRGRPAQRRWWPVKARYPLLGAAHQLAVELGRRLPDRQSSDDSPLWEESPTTGQGALASALGGENT